MITAMTVKTHEKQLSVVKNIYSYRHSVKNSYIAQ